VSITHKSLGRKMSDHPSPRHPPNLATPLLLHPGRWATQQLMAGNLSPGRRGRYHPRPPQTRTCAIHAFGSSRESFADDVMDAFGAILCHRHSLTEGIYLVSLAIHVVSWTRFAGCMSRPLFLDMVLSSRRLPSLLRVPPSMVPRSHRYYEGATTSHWRIGGRLFGSLPPPT
jgi:hypothetical protein